MENIENLKLYINSLSQSISAYESALSPLQNKQLSDMILNINTTSSTTSTTSTSEEQQIQILNNFAYLLISTLFSYLKSLGIDTDSHPIKMELSRIKSSMNRLKNIKNEINGDTNKQEEEEEEKEKLKKLKEYLSRTLGVRDVGLSVDVKSMGTSAISKQNFQGKHIKFDDHDNADEKKDDGNKNDLKKSKNKKSNGTGSSKSNLKLKLKLKLKLNVKESKITKPKSNKKSSTKNKNK